MAKLQGKTVLEIVDLGKGITLIRFEDGSFIVVTNMSDLQDETEIFDLDAPDSEEEEDDEEEDDEEEDDEDDEEEEEDDEEEDDEEEDDEEEDDEDDEDDLTADDLKDSDFDDLEDIVSDYDLDIKVKKFKGDEKKLRKAVAKELKIKL